jgi:glycosyltransferase involved in cell wall biosynthesis
MIKLSVIITTYNSEETIQRLLNSITSQHGINEYFNLELLVVDDCSTDNTLTILKENNIPFFQTETNSKGPNKGRNIGLKLATGDYICITDHDDEWKLDRIIKMLPYFHKYSIITSGYTVVDDEKKTEIHRVSKDTSEAGFVYYDVNKTFKQLLSKKSTGQNLYLGNIFLEKKFKNILFEEVFGLVDFDWILNLLHQQDSVEIKDSLYLRHVKNNNLSLNERYRSCDFHFSLMTIEKYFDEYPRLVKKSYKKIHGTRARYYYLMNQMPRARFYFLKSQINLKTVLFYVTTFIGSSFVKRKFHFFG